MAEMTEHYGLTIGVVTDEVIDPEHHNRTAATLDRVLGSVLAKLLAAGVFDGWLLNTDGEVTVGEGLVAGCWCRTVADTAVSDLTNGATNHVFARTDGTSAPDGTVDFVAQLSPTKPEGAVYLGTMTVDAQGEVTAVDSEVAGVDRDCRKLGVGEVSGSGVLEDYYSLAEGEMAPIEVEHDSEGEFYWAEPPRMAEAPGVIFLLDTSYTNGSRFRVWALRNDDAGGGWSGGAGDLEYGWTRRGNRQ